MQEQINVNDQRLKEISVPDTQQGLKLKRPNVSGNALRVLNQWVDNSLVVSNEALGEKVNDLYKDYLSFVTNENLDETSKSITRISRKNFPPTFLYLFETIRKETVVWIKGRTPFMGNVEFKKSG